MIFANKMKATVVACVAAITVVSASPAMAQGTPEQRSACMGDAFEYCLSDIPNVSKVEACLMQNRSRLKPACQAEFQSTGKTKIKSEHFK